jgi:hypothetical protein
MNSIDICWSTYNESVDLFGEDGQVEGVQGVQVVGVVGGGGEGEGEEGKDVEVVEDLVEEFGGEEGEGHFGCGCGCGWIVRRKWCRNEAASDEVR